MKQTPLHKRLELFTKTMQSIPKLAQKAFTSSLASFKSDMQEINKDALNEGEYVNQKKIEPEYADVTIKIKKAKNQRYDVVTLRDRGDFHNSIRYDVKTNSVEVTATDPKTEKLNEKYRTPKTREIYGMQPKRYNEGIFPLAVRLANYELFNALNK